MVFYMQYRGFANPTIEFKLRPDAHTYSRQGDIDSKFSQHISIRYYSRCQKVVAIKLNKTLKQF